MAKILTEGFFPDTMVACNPCEDTKPVTYKFNFVVTLPAFGKDVIDSYCCANQDDAIAYYNQKYPVGSGEVVVDDSDLADYTAYVESCNQKKTEDVSEDTESKRVSVSAYICEPQNHKKNRAIKEEFVKFIKENKVGELEDIAGYYEGFYVSVAVTPEERKILDDKLDELYAKYEFTECVKLQ